MLPREIQLEEQRKRDYLKFIEVSLCGIKDVVESVVRESTLEYAMHLDTDAWTNYRQTLQTALQKKVTSDIMTGEDYWAVAVRQVIYQEYKEELVNRLNQDLVEEVNNLKLRLKQAYERGPW